jgi:hypothetical protein
MNAEINTMTCWICNNPADTREHVIKQSDIRRLFGRGPYQKGKRLMRTDPNQRKRLIQSEDSVHIKYKRGLCENCNSARSQSWDEVYDKFMEFVQVSDKALKSTRRLDFNRIVQNSVSEFATNLYSYFVKAFGCQLQEQGQKPPSELSEYLLGNRDNTNLCITFAVYENMPMTLPSPMVEIHGLEGDIENNTKRPLNYEWAVSIEWLTVLFWYNKQPTVDLGQPWYGTPDQIRMGSYRNRNSS